MIFLIGAKTSFLLLKTEGSKTQVYVLLILVVYVADKTFEVRLIRHAFKFLTKYLYKAKFTSRVIFFALLMQWRIDLNIEKSDQLNF